jgi:hypothetical protein
MNQLKITTLAAAIVLVFSTGAMAAGMSKDDYYAGKDRISTDYRAARAACNSLASNAKDVCVADAEGKDAIAKAQLEAAYEPSLKARYEVSIAIAEGRYSVASTRCGAKAGNDKDVCIKEAKADEVAAKADAKAWLKTADANQVASDKTMAARADADADKRDADYAVAKEKCDTYAGDARANCLNDAKARFGK